MNTNVWHVYMVRCADNTLYAGVTNNLQRRIKQHNGELRGGARYTASRRPVVLAWEEETNSRGMAQKREIEIRHLSKVQKIKLIEKNKLAGSKAESS